MNPASMEFREARKIVTAAGERLILVRENITSWSVWGYAAGMSSKLGEITSNPDLREQWGSIVQGAESRWTTWLEACEAVRRAAAPSPYPA